MCNYKCFNNSDLSPSGGGICGWNRERSYIEDCYNKGEIENNGCNYASTNIQIGSIGGIVGTNGFTSGDDTAHIYRVYNVGTIKAYPLTTDARGTVAGGIAGRNIDKMCDVYNSGEILANENTITYIGGISGWEDSSQSAYNVYNIGKLSKNATYIGGCCGAWTEAPVWTNFYWLENMGASYVIGYNGTDLSGISTSTQIKALVSNGSLPSTDWVTTSIINSGYPHLKVFDDTSIWLRDSNINGGDPYLKDNPPQQ